MAAALASTDVMHYESRAIKEGLKASIKRLSAAKGYLPPSLTPEQLVAHGHVPQDWSAPKVSVDFQESSHPGSGDPRFEEMRTTLLGFEHGSYQAAGSRERAFYSALRTLLSDITVAKDDTARGLQITAAHRWFTKHRPRGFSEDPAVFAAMAASLSLQGVQQGQQRHMAGARDQGAARPFASQGTKHEFFAAYSKDAQPSDHAEGVGPRSPSPARVSETASRRPAPVPPRTSLMPVVMQPAVPSSHSPARREGGVAFGRSPEVHGNGGASTTGATGPQSSPPASASARDRSGADGSGIATGKVLATQAKGKGLGQGPKQPWSSGPFRDAAAAAGSSGRPKGDDAEIEALRRKWSAMDAASSKSVVEPQVQQWSQQRARLEEEIIRRQEASRYASPSMHMQGVLMAPGAGQQAMSKAEGYMSPYAGLVSHQMNFDNEAAPTTIPGLVIPRSVTATAREVRAKAQEQHSREVMKITRKFTQAGLNGAVSADAVEHALAPVPDKAYLECLARLPKPGDLLPSKPGSARTGGSGSKKGGKKRSTSASRTKR